MADSIFFYPFGNVIPIRVRIVQARHAFGAPDWCRPSYSQREVDLQSTAVADLLLTHI